MTTIKVDLPDIDTAEIHVLADHHYGDVSCDEQAIEAEIIRVRDTPNAYAILNGDIINWASKTSISDSYAEQYTPMEQIEIFQRRLDPIKDKILGLTGGNHERRAYRTEGIDLTRIVARQLGIEERYSPESLLLFVRLGDGGGKVHNRPICYSLYVNHGSGGGRKEGSKVTRLADMASIVDADIYIHSHTHMPVILREAYFRACSSNCSVQEVDRLFVNTSAALKYGGYGEMGEYKPNSRKSPVIYISGRYKMCEARL